MRREVAPAVSEGWTRVCLSAARVLLVSDDATFAAALTAELATLPHIRISLIRVSDAHEALTEMLSRQYHLCFLAPMIGKTSGVSLVEAALKKACAMPVVLLASEDILTEKERVLAVHLMACVPPTAINAHLVEHFLRHAHTVKALQQQVETLEAEVRSLAEIDALTGVGSRKLFEKALPMALERCQRAEQSLALMHIDLDQFRRINGMLGHGVGDRVLQQAGTRIRSVLRRVDSVFRFGGDEFVVLCEGNLNAQNLESIAGKIIDTLATPCFIEDTPCQISASVGIALAAAPISRSMDDLLREADIAMYCAKRNGRNTFKFYDADFLEEFLIYSQMTTALQFALAHNELSLCYQPLIEMKNGSTIGVEALLRWKHPTLGAVSPAEFIPVAEKTGLIIPIGEWVLREACMQKRRWEFAGFPRLRVAVNVSIHQLQHAGFVERVEQILHETDVDATGIELEVAENVLSSDRETCVKTMNRLRALGVHLVIDDFGTGYSNLGYLRDFPFEKIKIDKLFIDEIVSSNREQCIVEAIIAMAKRLGLEVVAEGVETEAQIQYLRRHHGTQIQGYYYSKPLSAKDCTDYLSRL